ncbi:L-lactate dehydrogenase [Secundilactobacillus odoratitofui DSM 19909 = JCM 15043]|uniref:L-lactate dehydrogenase n=1 Tax=Secundilactobacillus odoratitofui DSM 19909 = JCM 15043 TaxID=1423776 RepID=A0A0R1LM42_9LACO|nr:L-lactate dehydrogenase [Secundilactobacillus odoratitofui]KRK96925.1 L-lactate dehydrogenase [Secundilactobacillus odoratitofui DSM 19909 = JCM 15043]
MLKKHRKVLLVGDGAVGSSFAFSLLQNCGIDELVIVDIAKDHAVGDALDLEDLTPMMMPAQIKTGDYADASDADIVVITAGVPRKPGETRLDLVNKNTKILESIVTPVVNSGFSGCFVVSANPVDILTSLTQHISGFPKNRVIGTGTSLDSARLQVALGKALDVSTSDIDAYVLGEHGDSSFAAYNEATVSGRPLLSLSNATDEILSEIEEDVKKKGGQIIGKKGATFYGVAVSLMKICRAILLDENLVMPVSAPLDGQYGLKDIYLGTPAVINASGIRQVIEVSLSDEEAAKMQSSARKMNEILLAAE